MRVVIAFLLLVSSLCSGNAASYLVSGRVIGLFHPDQISRLRDAVEAIPGISIQKLDYQSSTATFTFSDELYYDGDLKRTREAIDRMLRGSTNGMFEFLPKVEEEENWKQVIIPIAGLDCMACSYAAYLAVCKIGGVCRATADFGRGKLEVWIIEKKISIQGLHDVLVKHRISTNYSLNYDILVSQRELSVVRVSSEEKRHDGGAENLLDGESQTIWHSQFSEPRADHPHEIVLDLGKSRRVKAVHYLPRQNPENNGQLCNTEFFISDNDSKFPDIPNARKIFTSLKSPQVAMLNSPKQGRYLLIRILSEINSKPDASIAELGIEEML